MRKLLPVVILICTMVSALAALPSDATAAASCQFVLGFKTIHDAIPTIVGDCVQNEQHNPLNGDAIQATTGVNGKGGLLVWRKIDNFTAFTDGFNSWVNGPNGLQERLNDDRFPWEHDRLSQEQLQNAEYSLKLIGDQPVTFHLTNGTVTLPDQLGTVTMFGTAYGDFNADGVTDAVVLLVHNGGGSGQFIYAVAVLDKNNSPVELGAELLGDRVKVNAVLIGDHTISVDMIIQGPNDPLCCPTQHVVQKLHIAIP